MNGTAFYSLTTEVTK